jgi:hypothetical protein
MNSAGRMSSALAPLSSLMNFPFLPFPAGRGAFFLARRGFYGELPAMRRPGGRLR